MNKFHNNHGVDNLYDLTVAIVKDERKTGISFIQRRFKIGYNRAARIMAMMEEQGIVGSMNNAGGRPVLAPYEKNPN